MEQYEELRASARRKLQVADHLLTMTYPFVRDPKLLVVVLENIFLACTQGMRSLLHYERTYKRIPAFPSTFSGALLVFQENCLEKYQIEAEYVGMVREIRDLIQEHKKSPIEFSRKDKFIICNEEYDMKTITLDTIRGYLTKTKGFMKMVDTAVQ